MYFIRIIIISLSIQWVQAQSLEPFQDYYDSGQLKAEGFMKDGKRHGSWKSYYKNGQLSGRYSYTNGKRDKAYTFFFKDGTVRRKNEEIDGIYIQTGYYETGELLYKRQYLSGYYKEFYKTGVLKNEAVYSNGKLIGVWKEFYEEGSIKWEVTYKNDYREGSFSLYHHNGKIKREGQMLKDKIEGMEKRYSNEGFILWKGSYLNGQLHKTWTKYDEDGNKVEKVKFRNGLLQGDSGFGLTPTKVPIGLLERVPIFPNCEKHFTNTELKKCMSQQIGMHVNKSFNTDIAEGHNITGRNKILIKFKVDETGEIVEIDADTPHEVFRQEAVRIIRMLPKLKPGLVRGEPVTVPYTFPLVFQVAK